MSAARRRAVFLDRDGTLHRELERAPTDPSQLELFPGALEAAARLASEGFALVLVTNQSAIARGTATLSEVEAVNRGLAERMAGAGAPLAGIYLCPHHPDEGDPPYRRVCTCRKPAPGLIQRAARELDLDLARSWVIGDAERDLEAGSAMGVNGMLVLTGKGTKELARLKRKGQPVPHVAHDLREASMMLLALHGKVAAGLERIERDLRALAAGEPGALQLSERIWAEAFPLAQFSQEVLWPMWLQWGALTDWATLKPEEAATAEAEMRRAAREWLEVSENQESLCVYFVRWLTELGYDMSGVEPRKS